MIEEVVCKLCGKKTPSVFGERKFDKPSTQGHECASYVTKDPHDGWILVGCYDSKFDTTVFVFKDEPEENVRNADPVCDDCIKTLLKDKKIRKERTGEIGL